MSCINFSNNGIDLTQSSIGEVNVGIVFCFVVKESGMSENMKLSYEVSVCMGSNIFVKAKVLFQAAREKITDPEAFVVMTESECLNFPKEKFCQQDRKSIFIFDEFNKENEAFNYIYNAKTVL